MEINLKELFEKHPLSIAGVAERIGMHRTLLSSKVNGTIRNNKESKPSPAELKKIEEYLHELGEDLQKIRLNSK